MCFKWKLDSYWTKIMFFNSTCVDVLSSMSFCLLPIMSFYASHKMFKHLDFVCTSACLELPLSLSFVFWYLFMLLQFNPFVNMSLYFLECKPYCFMHLIVVVFSCASTWYLFMHLIKSSQVVSAEILRASEAGCPIEMHKIPIVRW